MIKNNFYVITGGPGGGKTTLLENLASKGYSYIPETARQIIKDRLLLKLSPRPDPITFAHKIFKKDLSNFSKNSNDKSLIFFDRSFIDSAWQIFNSDQNGYNRIKNFYLTCRYNTTVFITPPWEEIYQNDSERDQTFSESIAIYEQLYEWYKKHDYKLVQIPKDTIEKRAAFLLNHLVG